MREIPLFNKTEVVKVDAEDYGYLSQFRWTLPKLGYAARHEKGETIYMHREIMKLKKGDGKYVDHINHDKLDNRKDNLRVCTKSQNQSNQQAKKKLDGSSQSKYKGVSLRSKNRGNKPWRCRIAYKGKTITKYFATEKEAAIAYNKLAIEIHGEFAYLNEIE